MACATIQSNGRVCRLLEAGKSRPGRAVGCCAPTVDPEASVNPHPACVGGNIPHPTIVPNNMAQELRQATHLQMVPMQFKYPRRMGG